MIKNIQVGSDPIPHDLAKLLDQNLPISIKNNESLIDRIYSRYPLLSKSEISMLVRTIFQSMRELLVAGHTLNFNGLWFDMKLYFFNYVQNSRIYPALKMHISTPAKLRKYV